MYATAPIKVVVSTPVWVPLVAGFGGALLGGVLSFVGNQRGARTSTKLAGEIAREQRRLQREEEVLVNIRRLLSHIENMAATVIRAIRDAPDQNHPSNHHLDEEIEYLNGTWAHEEHAVKDSVFLAGYRAANWNERARQWSSFRLTSPRPNNETIRKFAQETQTQAQKLIARIKELT